MVSSLVAAWLYTHPRVRRVWLAVQLIWGGALLAVLTAPTAAAQGISGALSWTGLHDSYNMPIGSHFVSVVPMTEAIREQGPDFGASPETWGPAIVSKFGTALTYTQLATWLGFECAVLVCICAVGIWFVKFALSTTWLGWLAAIASPVLANITDVVNRLYLVPGAMTICAAIGGVVALTRGVGSGIGIIFSGILVIVLAAVFLRDPVGEIAGEDGILGIGRTVGFTVSQGVANNGPLAPGGSEAQLEQLTSWLVDVTVRQPIQLINFGKVIDDVPGCAQLYNSALAAGDRAAPAHAMRYCDLSALEYAQQLDTISVGLFAFLILAIFVVLFAVDYVGCEVIRVGFKAFWNVLVIVPAAAVAVAPGPQRQFAKRTALKLIVHGLEMIVATAGLGILVILMANVTRGALPGTIAMTHPMAKIMVLLLLGVGGAIGFRHLLHAFGDRGMPGPVRIGSSVLRNTVRVGQGLESVDYAGRRLGGLRSRLSERRGSQDKSDSDTASSPKAPGRQAHPPAKTDRRPPSAPSSGSARRPGPSGPGRGPRGDGGGTGAATPGARTAGTATSAHAKASASKAAASGAARTATKVAAPEVAAAAAAAGAAQHAASHLRHRGQGQHQQPHNAPGRTPASPQQQPNRTGTGRAPQPNRNDPNGRDQQPPPRGPRSGPAPGRGGPTPR